MLRVLPMVCLKLVEKFLPLTAKWSYDLSVFYHAFRDRDKSTFHFRLGNYNGVCLIEQPLWLDLNVANFLWKCRQHGKPCWRWRTAGFQSRRLHGFQPSNWSRKQFDNCMLPVFIITCSLTTITLNLKQFFTWLESGSGLRIVRIERTTPFGRFSKLTAYLSGSIALGPSAIVVGVLATIELSRRTQRIDLITKKKLPSVASSR